jgi:hypothetical protein
VITPHARVTVVGTEFTLGVGETQSRVVVSEGAVRVSKAMTAREESLADVVAHDVNADQQAVAEVATRISINVTPVERDAARWPFPVDSPWNRPLGDGARLAPLQPAVAFGELSGVAKPVRIEAGSTNGRTLRLMRQNRELAKIPAPEDFSLNGAIAEMHLVVMPDRLSVWEIIGSRPTGTPGEMSVTFAQRGSLTNSGFGGEWATIPRHAASA